MNKDILERIDINQFNKFLDIAIKAKDKFGNRGQWIIYFGRAINGINARIFALKDHYANLQLICKQMEFPLDFIELDYHLSDIFYNLDSTIECFVFGLNAIGYGIMDSKLFISIEDEKKLKKIKPDNIFIVGKNSHYQKYFTSIFNYWLEDSQDKFVVTPKKLWESIRDQHDVFKHRSSHTCKMVQTLGNETDIPLTTKPKKPLTEVIFDCDGFPWTLNDYLQEFVPFINKSFVLVIQDLESFLQHSN